MSSAVALSSGGGAPTGSAKAGERTPGAGGHLSCRVGASSAQGRCRNAKRPQWPAAARESFPTDERGTSFALGKSSAVWLLLLLLWQPHEHSDSLKSPSKFNTHTHTRTHLTAMPMQTGWLKVTCAAEGSYASRVVVVVAISAAAAVQLAAPMRPLSKTIRMQAGSSFEFRRSAVCNVAQKDPHKRQRKLLPCAPNPISFRPLKVAETSRLCVHLFERLSVTH